MLLLNHQHSRRKVSCRLRGRHWRCIQQNLRPCCFGYRRAACRAQQWSIAVSSLHVPRSSSYPNRGRPTQELSRNPLFETPSSSAQFQADAWHNISTPTHLHVRQRQRRGRYLYWCDGKLPHLPCVCASLSQRGLTLHLASDDTELTVLVLG